MKTPASAASVIGVEGRRLYIFVDDYASDGDKFAYTMNGEPVHVTHSAVHKHDIARGLNLIANGTFANCELPWRAGSGDGASVGLNLSPQWRLAGAGTAYLTTASGTPAQAEYLYGAENPLIPVIAGERYAFSGHFALHRCSATVNIDLLTSGQTLLDSQRHHIPRKRGGQSLEDYALVDFNVPVSEQGAYARIRFSIESCPAHESAGSPAYLFFTHIAFSAAGDAPIAWRPREIKPRQIAALSGRGAVLDVTFPRFAANGHAPPPTFDIIDRTTGRSIENAPITLPPAAELGFTVASFDGVTLGGTLTLASERLSIELVIDDVVAERRSFEAAAEHSRQSVSFRIPDRFLDGSPHVLELRDVASGSTLFVNAVTLKALVTSWEQTDDLGRLALPTELHPIARRRYRSLLAHVTAAAHDPAQCNTSQSVLGRCHDVLVQADVADADLSPLALPDHHVPDVSVIVATSDVTQIYRTIAALLLAYNDSSFDVVISTDDDPGKIERLRRLISGALFMTSPTKLSRAELLNRGAEAARGQFIALLDARAEPGACWIDELRATLSLFDGAGIAGAKLVKPNGRLLDAGGVLWSSGHRQTVGANGNAEHPQVNYTRPVDFVSDRALMMPVEIWRAIGGLSEDLFGTSLEDVDLALKVRDAGYKVLYAPQAVVTIWPEAGSPRTAKSPASHFKRRWSQALQQRPPETAPLRTAIDFGVKERVLFIDQQVPRADVDAGGYAAVQEMRLFQALGYKVTFLPLNLAYSEAYVTSLARMGVEVIYAPFAASVEDVLKERGDEFQVVYITRYHVARAVVPFVRRHNPQAKIVFNNADLHFLRELRSALALNDGELLRRSQLTRDMELEVMRQTDLTVSYSEVEHAVIMSHNLDQTRIAKAPWVVTPVEAPLPFGGRTDIGFLGSFGHRPNVDAMRFFVGEVLPLLRQSAPDLHLLVFGSQITPEVRALAGDHVIIKGHVDDLADAFGTLKVFVAPLTAGAGVKGKVLHAMANGLPTVLSPAAAEGIGAHAGIHYLAAQTPQEWVTAITKLAADATLWNAISRQSLDFVRQTYSFDRGVATLRAALEKIDIFPAERHDALCCRAATSRCAENSFFLQ